MLTPDQEAAIIVLCEIISMPWEKRKDTEPWDHPWTGAALNLTRVSPNGTSDFVHDVAHWLVAAPWRRGEDDFGLDRMAYFRELDDLDYPNPGDSIEEELQASMLGILLERAMGLDWRYTWEFHRWHTDGRRGVRPVIRALRHRGLIRGLTPTCLLDATSSAPRR